MRIRQHTDLYLAYDCHPGAKRRDLLFRVATEPAAPFMRSLIAHEWDPF